ncbi:divalent cation tolerance protein CutA [Allomuricauda sp. SCSIO 65647]|uniref:divalent cation tolerance protein CutA n=1 Tax=Allomuricauda sp. SCSIO 65647 TaxID=2908843 RepID=UPI001F29052B|nr:divalent cation tolerance protein CutA [Muricauda sp. SCSIO 65647]UJH66165.1 divalent cation tolerance protein CutA [Muricauda sp. SCSIO 65647]
MVLVHIICESKSQALDIVDVLIEERLMLDAMISDKLLFKRLKSGETESHERTLVMGTTKALLFKTIDQRIKQVFTSTAPLVYAMPIVYMNAEQTQELQAETRKV